MTVMTAGVTPANEAYEGVVWNVLGQTYTLKEESEASMSWHALFPAGTFVPPHQHSSQDEFIYMLEGKLDIELEGVGSYAVPGDLIRLPMGKPHGFFNRSGLDMRCLFWVAPARSIRALFNRLHNLPDPVEVMRISALHEVDFLPPPA